MIRQLSQSDLDPAADYLDSRTLVLRWLVAFVRGLPSDAGNPESRGNAGGCGPSAGVDSRAAEARGPHSSGRPDSCSLWWDLRDDPSGRVREGLDAIRCVLAYFRVNRTLYVAGDPDADYETIEELSRESLLPCRLVGDADILDGWRAALPGIFESAARIRELDVLVYEGAGSIPAGFRLAGPTDAGLLGEYLHLLYDELEEVGPPSVDALIGAEMVHVLEEDARVKGMVIANPSDGRYVHASGVYVHPAYRGRGVGRRLAGGLGAAVLSAEGVPVLLDAFRDSAQALAAYRAAGYRRRGGGRVVWLGDGAWEGADPFPLGGDVEDG